MTPVDNAIRSLAGLLGLDQPAGRLDSFLVLSKAAEQLGARINKDGTLATPRSTRVSS